MDLLECCIGKKAVHITTRGGSYSDDLGLALFTLEYTSKDEFMDVLKDRP